MRTTILLLLMAIGLSAQTNNSNEDVHLLRQMWKIQEFIQTTSNHTYEVWKPTYPVLADLMALRETERIKEALDLGRDLGALEQRMKVLPDDPKTNNLMVAIKTNLTLISSGVLVISTDKAPHPPVEWNTYLRTALTNGEACRVQGHLWQPHQPMIVNAVYHTDGLPEQRQCALCRMIQQRTKTEWK